MPEEKNTITIENIDDEVVDTEEVDVEAQTYVQDEVVDSPFGKLKTRGIVNEMETSYLNYAMSVIVARALPDVRDGLKPVHRRILYMMSRAGMHYSGPHKKCARIVGDVMGRYHPHGDSSIYMALVRLAQDFSMRYPLIDGQGNFGSIDGDSPAAMRYTEARLAKIAAAMTDDLDKETVEMVDNYNGELKEPSVLPGKLPNLLLMGSEGIAVGMATKIPTHNLVEVCQAIMEMVKMGSVAAAEGKELFTFVLPADSSKVSTESDLIDTVVNAKAEDIAGVFSSTISHDEIMTFIKGPDFPTGGIIYDAKAIAEAYATGRGRIITRAKAEIVESKKGGFQIVATEIPYQVNKTKLIEKIAQLVKDKRIVGIRDINDYSDRKGLNITIDLKKDAKPKVVLNKLFQLSEFQTSFSLNMVALNAQGVPQLMNLKQVLREYITHRELVIIKRSQFELVKARNRAHILEGLLIALDNIDEVIKTIRESYDDAKEKLMERFKLSEVQSLAILEMQLKRLQGLERDKLEEEYKEIQKTIIKLLTLLNDPQKILAKLAEETQELIDAYGDERRTKVVRGKVGEFSEEDLISNETAIVTLTQTGYIKRLSPDSFRAQSRGGKGATGVKMKEEDVVKNLLTVNTHDYIMLFTNFGRVFKLRAFEIPEASRQAKGTAVVNLISLKAEEKVENILIIDPQRDAEKFVALATKMGLVKKTAVKQFDNIRQNGIIAIDLNKDDNLVWGKITTGEDDIMLVTHKGKSIRFSEKEVKVSARDTKGVKGITLGKEDYVVGVESINQEEKNNDNAQHLLVVTENGLGKRTKLSEYPLQKRSGMGVKVSEVTAKTGDVAMASKADMKSEDLIISTQLGQTIKISLAGKSVPVLSRATQGVILIRPEKGDKVVTATVTIKQEIEEAAKLV